MTKAASSQLNMRVFFPNLVDEGLDFIDPGIVLQIGRVCTARKHYGFDSLQFFISRELELVSIVAFPSLRVEVCKVWYKERLVD